MKSGPHQAAPLGHVVEDGLRCADVVIDAGLPCEGALAPHHAHPAQAQPGGPDLDLHPPAWLTTLRPAPGDPREDVALSTMAQDNLRPGITKGVLHDTAGSWLSGSSVVPVIAALQRSKRAHPLKTLSGGECATNSVSMASRVPALGASSGPRGLKVGGFRLTPGCCSRQPALSGVRPLTQQPFNAAAKPSPEDNLEVALHHSLPLCTEGVCLLSCNTMPSAFRCTALPMLILPPHPESVLSRSLVEFAVLTCSAEAVQSVWKASKVITGAGAWGLAAASASRLDTCRETSALGPRAAITERRKAGLPQWGCM